MLLLSLSSVSFAKSPVIEFDESDLITNKQEAIKGSVQADSKEARMERFKAFMRGEKAHDQIIGGMWSKHFSKNNYRETHNIMGIQYKGWWLSTFKNSHDRQVTTFGIARTVMKKQIKEDLLFDVGYKVGPMYGYREGAPDISGFSILPFVCLGLSYHNVGFSVNIVPGNVISLYTYINMDAFRNVRDNIRNKRANRL